MNRRSGTAAALIALLIASGCASRQSGHYRVARVGGANYLLPPVYKENLKRPEREITVRVNNVLVRQAGCKVEMDEFILRPRGSGVHVVVRPVALFSGGSTIRSFRASFETLRGELAKLEEQGCLKPGAGRTVAEAVAESLPIPVMETLFYSYGYDPFHGYCEVHPGMRIHAQRALLEKDASGKDKLTRIDRALYAVGRQPGGDGLRFAIEKREGSEASIPGLDQLNSSFSRFFFHIKFNNLEGKPQRTAVVMGASTLPRLQEVTNRLWKDADLTCSQASGFDCVKSPAGQIVTAEVPVRLNGKPTTIPVSFTINDVLRDRKLAKAGGPPPPIELRRMFRGKLTKVEFQAKDYSLPVTAGDRLDVK